MKGGGLTWVGWVMVGVGGMLVYAGMTGTSLVTELGNVLNGRKPGGGVDQSSAPTSPPIDRDTAEAASQAVRDTAANVRAQLDALERAAAASRKVPYPVIPTAPGGSK